jgi:two-component system LytT family response regulator
MRAIIIDDERLARNELSRLLAAHTEIEIVGVAENAGTARDAIRSLHPDLIFVDVQMPGESGFDLLESLDSVPLVVFTTAYDEYALRAFEVNALDYLVKPIDPRRLARTVQRLTSLNAAIDAEENEPPGMSEGSVSGDEPRPLSEHDRVFVSQGERSWLIEIRRIRLFEAAGNHTRILFDSEQPLLNRSLNQLELRLDSRVFFRANRHQIINLKAVKAIHPWFGGRMLAVMDDGREITLSRRRATAFRDMMSI